MDCKIVSPDLDKSDSHFVSVSLIPLSIISRLPSKWIVNKQSLGWDGRIFERSFVKVIVVPKLEQDWITFPVGTASTISYDPE